MDMLLHEEGLGVGALGDSAPKRRGSSPVRGNTRTLKVLPVFGTRPEGIKMMPVIRELRARAEFEQIVCVTGQHRQMLDQVFSAFGERVDIDLDVMSPGQTLTELTARIVVRIAEVLAQEKPDLVLVHGDTTTAVATAMAAFYARIPVAHVEAGLRSYDLDHPWPEEFNRVAIDSIASMMFAPTERSAANLRQEYNRNGRIMVTGNTGIDALMYIAEQHRTQPELRAATAARYPFLDSNRRLILVTGHRRESFGVGFQSICDGLLKVAERDDVQLVYPVHLNPNVNDVVRGRLSACSNILLIPPVDYIDMVYLMQRASVLITDSGGIQEEGPALGKPVLVMRTVTERPEALESGGARLIGTDPMRMRSEVDALLDDPDEYERRAQPRFPYGNGTAAIQIADAIGAMRVL